MLRNYHLRSRYIWKGPLMMLEILFHLSSNIDIASLWPFGWWVVEDSNFWITKNCHLLLKPLILLRNRSISSVRSNLIDRFRWLLICLIKCATCLNRYCGTIYRVINPTSLVWAINASSQLLQIINRLYIWVLWIAAYNWYSLTRMASCYLRGQALI